ncbi:hypothetical protein M422DRAFT_255097 [Sphaerobolus stellatus SS14]|uniref:Uncharacterized protein n=1 Tax=Sphaerobolus stellatus (strain SS14) TaxID=990650 RepID=A0A0C9VTC2_SPHS4|nr:hypothetical protein M422DRAFT_255097 [Sphaerobolus stellatus SS14]
MSISSAVETSLFPSYFSAFPVCTHCNVAATEVAMHHAIEECTEPGSKDRKQSLHRHKGSVKLYTFTYPGGRTDKLQFVVKIVELTWVHDDINEEKPHQSALHEHEVLRQALHPEFGQNTDTGETVGAKKAYFQKIRQEIIALDPIDTPKLLHTLHRYLEEYDSHPMDTKTMDDVCIHFLRWAMDIHLSDDEFAALKDFEDAMMRVVGLTDDYFSWGKEKYLSSDHSWNALPILMKQFNLPEKEAEWMLKGMIINAEILPLLKLEWDCSLSAFTTSAHPQNPRTQKVPMPTLPLHGLLAPL